MTKDEFKNLRPGDVVRHSSGKHAPLTVMSNYGNRVTAATTADMTNPSEWDLIAKCELKLRIKK